MNPERLNRMNQLLRNRQTDLTVCMESVHKSHNLAAIVRTADAVGVHEVHTVWKSEKMMVNGGTAMGSQNWVKVNRHPNIQTAISTMKNQGMQVLATNLSENAVDFREIDYTKPTAILLGQEKYGISEEALELADQHIIIPMVGMVQSLNVSVANALILYEAQRQRQLAGMYADPQDENAPCRVSAEERARVLFEGGHPVLAKVCKEKNLPLPDIDEDGEVIASEDWWHKMQTPVENW